MTTDGFIIELFYRVDNAIGHLPKHTHAKLHPSETTTLAVLYSLRGGGKRAFCRWLHRDHGASFPELPDRTRLFRLFVAHQDWARLFLEDPTVLGVIDSYGIELLHPVREGRSPRQIGRKSKSNKRWIVGGKLCLVLNQFSLVVNFDCDTAGVHDTMFQGLIRLYEDWMVILSDNGFHAQSGDPANLKVCQVKRWNDRMVIETVFSMPDDDQWVQAHARSGVGVLRGASELRGCRVQPVGAVAWVSAGRERLHPALHCRVQPLTQLAPLVN